MRFPLDPSDRVPMRLVNDTLASNPNDIDANYTKGMILLDLCCNDEALACFENVLRQDPKHMKSQVGKGRALAMEHKYDKAIECFESVPDGDDAHREAMDWKNAIDSYRVPHMREPTSTPETADEKKFNDSLENWMSQHLGEIQNLGTLLHNFKEMKDGPRRKPGNVFHADLVRRFYERGGTLKVIAVECKDIEPGTDVDIRLDDDIYIQAWYGRKPAEYARGQNPPREVNGPMDLDRCEQLRPVLKKLNQLPSNKGKGFVLNCVPGISGIVSPSVHHLCSERTCVMEIRNTNHINVYGKSDFKYCNEARRIAQVLDLPPYFLLGDWAEMQAWGRDPIGESVYGINVFPPQPTKFWHMDKDELLDYAKRLKCPDYDELVNCSHDQVRHNVWWHLMSRDSNCQEDKP